MLFSYTGEKICVGVGVSNVYAVSNISPCLLTILIYHIKMKMLGRFFDTVSKIYVQAVRFEDCIVTIPNTLVECCSTGNVESGYWDFSTFAKRFSRGA
jgi:hypothetical protein